MIDYSPSWIQWLLLTAAVPASLIFTLVAAVLLIRLMAVYRKSADGSPMMKLGLPAMALIAVAMVLPGLAPVGELNTQVKSHVSSMSKLKDIRLAHVETESITPLNDGSVMFVGTGTNSDKDQIQFIYTQFERFGVYETVGFGNSINAENSDGTDMPPILRAD